MDTRSEERNESRIIGSLPDDVAMLCLAKVPRKFHVVLKCVCRRWRDLIGSEDWYAYRRKHNLSETWIYALCRDKFDRNRFFVLDPNSSRRCWKEIKELPPRCLKRKGMGFHAIGKYLYLLGGCGWSEDATTEAYRFDASANTWHEIPSLSIPRCYFACEVLNEKKICAIGGLGSKLSNPHSWDTYDPLSSSWDLRFNDTIISDVVDSVTFDGKIYLRGGAASTRPLLVHDPAAGEWSAGDADMEVGWQGPSVVADDTLYVLDQRSGTRLMMWVKEKAEWAAVGRLSPLLVRPSCQLVAMGKTIFVVGKGLKTVVINVGNIGLRVMICNSMFGLDSEEDDYDVVRCACVAL